MTNTIVDAGTDAKIARFQRRGIELIDLAILEPVEVWGEKPRGIKASRPVTPDPSSTTAGSSSASLSSTSHAQPTPTVHQPMQLQQIQPSPAPSKRNLFGKMFKKNKDGTPPVSPAPSPSNSIFSANATPTQNSLNPMAAPVTTPTQSRTHVRNLSATLSPTTISGKLRNRSSSPNPQLVGLGLRVPMQHDEANASNTDLSIAGSTAEEKILRPPVLGIQPTLSYSYTPSATAGPPAPVPAASLARTARALMYVWFVRKWLKRRAEDEGGGLFGAMRATARGSALIGAVQPAPGPVEEGVEVRFEWKRAGVKGKGKKDREGERRGRRSTGDAPEPGGRRDISNRLSVISHQSFSTNVSVSEDGHGHSPLRKERGVPPRSGTPIRDREQRGSQGEGDREPVDLDDGEDSDPEDSETPWVCTLKIRRAGATGSTPSGSTRSRRQATGNGKGNGDWQGQGTGGDDELGVLPSGPQVVRIKVGTLSPTPHHPKVVAMLKVPFPLPDVEVERMGVVRRPMGEHLHFMAQEQLAIESLFVFISLSFYGSCVLRLTWLFLLFQGPPNARPPSQWPGTTLTAEEIKDVVCSTGMWLVVREGFGGVGKVSRKGDGWRLRA